MMSAQWLEPGEWTWTDTKLSGANFQLYTSRRKTFRERWLSVPWKPWNRYVLRRYHG